MNLEESDWIINVLLIILGVSVLIAIIVIGKTFANEAKEKKAKVARLAAEEKTIPHEPQVAAPAKPKKPAKAAKPSKPSKAAKTLAKNESKADDDLVAAAEVYLTYELKDQAILSLEKHLLKNPTDKKALDLLKKAESAS